MYLFPDRYAVARHRIRFHGDKSGLHLPRFHNTFAWRTTFTATLAMRGRATGYSFCFVHRIALLSAIWFWHSCESERNAECSPQREDVETSPPRINLLSDSHPSDALLLPVLRTTSPQKSSSSYVDALMMPYPLVSGRNLPGNGTGVKYIIPGYIPEPIPAGAPAFQPEQMTGDHNAPSRDCTISDLTRSGAGLAS